MILPTRLAPLCWLFAILLVGLFLRAWPLSESLWVDELHTAWAVSEDLSDVLPRARLGNNGPLYFWLIYGVTQITGLHESSLRVISLLSGVGLVMATFAVAQKWSCALATSLLAAGLVAIDTNAVFFSCEARTYALVQLVAIAHMYRFWQLLTSREPGVGIILAWFITAILLFHLHCTTALVFVAEIVAYIIAILSVPQQVKLSPLLFVVGLGAIAVGTLPAAGLLSEVADRRENWELFVKQKPLLATLNIYPLHTYVVAPLIASGCLWALTRFLRNDSSSQFICSRSRETSGTCANARTLTDQPAVGAPATTTSRLTPNWEVPNDTVESEHGQPGDVDWVPLIICASWLMVPIIAAWLLTELDLARLFFRRYVISSSVALAPLTALLLTSASRGRHLGSAAVAVGLVAILTISPAKYALSGWNALSHSGENWRDAVAFIAAGDRNTPVLVRSGLIEADDWSRSEDRDQREYCLLPIRGIYRLPEQDAPVIPLPTSLALVLSAAEKDQLRQYARVWLVIRDSRDGQVSKHVVKDVVAELGQRFAVKQTIKFGRVLVVELAYIDLVPQRGD